MGSDGRSEIGSEVDGAEEERRGFQNLWKIETVVGTLLKRSPNPVQELKGKAEGGRENARRWW